MLDERGDGSSARSFQEPERRRHYRNRFQNEGVYLTMKATDLLLHYQKPENADERYEVIDVTSIMGKFLVQLQYVPPLETDPVELFKAKLPDGLYVDRMVLVKNKVMNLVVKEYIK